MATALGLGAVGVFLLLWSPTARAVVCCGDGGGGGGPILWDMWTVPSGTGLWSVDGNWTDSNTGTDGIHRSPGIIGQPVELDFSHGSTAGSNSTDDQSVSTPDLVYFGGANALFIQGGTTLTAGGVTVEPGAIAAITVAGTFNLTPADPNTGSEDIVLSSGTFSIGGGATIGSLAGDTGTVNLGANQLTIGTRNQSTTYGGVIQGTGGSLKLTGGTLALSNTNTYTGGTTVNGGTLYVTSGSSTASGTGSGNVVVNSGATIGGFGMIGGNLTVNSGATLSPGVFSTRRITIGGALSLSGTLAIQLSNVPLDGFNDQVQLENGATIDPLNATLSLSLVAGFTPTLGEQFVIMEDTNLTTPITGFFSNAAATATDNAGNIYHVAYTGTEVILTDLGPAAVPEPSTFLLLIGAATAGGLLRVVRRKA